VEENRELVAAQARERVAAAQTRFEPARGRDEQLVADHVPEAVVDDLESIEIQVEDREAAAGATPAAFVEPAAEALDEDGAIERAGERILEADASQLLLRDRLLGGVGERPGDAIGLLAGAAHRETAAEKTSIRAVFVPDAVLVLKHLRRPREVRVERRV